PEVATRRQFLQSAAAAIVPPALIPRAVRVSNTSSLASSERPSFYKVIVDERFAASIAFGRRFSDLGTPVHVISGDVTGLWFHDLYFAWQRGRAPIAGMTTAESLFCLEILARDAGLRVTRRRALDRGLVAWSIERRG